jgi:hypothetical protein
MSSNRIVARLIASQVEQLSPSATEKATVTFVVGPTDRRQRGVTNLLTLRFSVCPHDTFELEWELTTSDGRKRLDSGCLVFERGTHRTIEHVLEGFKLVDVRDPGFQTVHDAGLSGTL